MGLLDFLFGTKQKSPANSAAKALNVSIIGGILTIDEIDFFGLFSKSDSEEWIIAWKDGYDGRGGHRENGLGRYVLINVPQNRIFAQGNMERPNSGMVSDSGIFSLEDWRFGSELNGAFFVFSPAGEMLIQKSVAANIFNSGISDTGRLAVFQTANGPSQDGNKFFAFDVEMRAELFGINPPIGWADKYEFSEDGQYIVVSQNGIGKFKYDLSGNFIDQKKYDAAKLKSKRFEIALPALAEVLKNESINRETAEKALKIISAARLAGADKQKSWKALALKLQGLAYEAIGDVENALAAFEEAQVLNPKIGVKQKIKNLKK